MKLPLPVPSSANAILCQCHNPELFNLMTTFTLSDAFQNIVENCCFWDIFLKIFLNVYRVYSLYILRGEWCLGTVPQHVRLNIWELMHKRSFLVTYFHLSALADCCGVKCVSNNRGNLCMTHIFDSQALSWALFHTYGLLGINV